MYQILTIFLLVCTTLVNSTGIIERKGDQVENSVLGVVDPLRRCGGLATQRQLRISECSGHCQFVPGTLYHCENDFMPSQSIDQLTLKVEICFSGEVCMNIITTELENSAVHPGFLYMAKFSFIPNDILSGQTVEFRASLLASSDLHVEVCVAADVDVL